MLSALRLGSLLVGDPFDSISKGRHGYSTILCIWVPKTSDSLLSLQLAATWMVLGVVVCFWLCGVCPSWLHKSARKLWRPKHFSMVERERRSVHPQSCKRIESIIHHLKINRIISQSRIVSTFNRVDIDGERLFFFFLVLMSSLIDTRSPPSLFVSRVPVDTIVPLS